MKSLFMILFTGLLTISYGQNSLIGKWRRINANAKQDLNGSKLAQTGDLILNPDSTFFIQGDTATQNSAISGWHSGAEYKGTWEWHSNHVLLFLAPKQDRLFLPYLIIKLTNEKLVLRSAMDIKGNKFYYSKYRRI
jgi:hypothetical protein